MKTRQVGGGLARYLLVGAMGAALIGCGGSSGDDDDPIDGNGDFGGGGGLLGDIDNDGIPDDEDDDIDGDGLLNVEDDDIDGDGFANDEDDDIDGDGIPNDEDDDAESDGFIDVSADRPCGGDSTVGSGVNSDANSSNFDWDDNCRVSRFGQFTDSLYSAGIQRVVYCAGFGNASSVDAFTDGEFGPGTEEAVEQYQAARNLNQDGVVGPETWGELQDELVRIDTVTDDEGSFDRYTVPGERCGDQVLFYNEVEFLDGGTSIDQLGWTLARGAGSDERVEFSIAEPFGRID